MSKSNGPLTQLQQRSLLEQFSCATCKLHYNSHEYLLYTLYNHVEMPLKMTLCLTDASIMSYATELDAETLCAWLGVKCTDAGYMDTLWNVFANPAIFSVTIDALKSGKVGQEATVKCSRSKSSAVILGTGRHLQLMPRFTMALAMRAQAWRLSASSAAKSEPKSTDNTKSSDVAFGKTALKDEAMQRAIAANQSLQQSASAVNPHERKRPKVKRGAGWESDED